MLNGLILIQLKRWYILWSNYLKPLVGEENKQFVGINFEAIKIWRYLSNREQKFRRIVLQKDTTVVWLNWQRTLGVNEATIRIEIGYRQASWDKLEFDCPKAQSVVETLIDRQIDSYNDVPYTFAWTVPRNMNSANQTQRFWSLNAVIQTKDETILQRYRQAIWYNERQMGEWGYHKPNCRMDGHIPFGEENDLRQKSGIPLKDFGHSGVWNPLLEEARFNMIVNNINGN